MKIAQIIPGSGGGFYCENCARDMSLNRALRAIGLKVTPVPLYLPPRDEGAFAASPVFYGGINTYLQQVSPLFRRTPGWVDRIFDANWLLSLAAGQAGSTRARSLGEMTLSVLRGEEGNQAKELERLASWLAGERPEVIHLSNVLLIGLARRLRQATGAAIVCSLQDELPWIASMGSPWEAQCLRTITERTGDVDLFASVSRAYAEKASARLLIPPERIRVVHVGVEAGKYPPAPLTDDPPAIGFLSRMSEHSGLGMLVDAFIRLKREQPRPDLRLLISGGRTADDDDFLNDVRRRLTEHGLANSVDFLLDFGFESRMRFLSSLSVFSVPGAEEAASGLAAIEAMAAGVPVVEPDTGAYPEIIKDTGGGLLFTPGDTAALTGCLSALLSDRDRARELGRRGREGVRLNFTVERMARETAEVFRQAVSARG